MTPQVKRKPRGRPFRKGESGNPHGRPRGSRNKASVEAKALCHEIVHDPDYQAQLRERAKAGELPPPVETMLWHYAAGKPRETVEVVNVDPLALARLPADELEEVKAQALEAQRLLAKLSGRTS